MRYLLSMAEDSMFESRLKEVLLRKPIREEDGTPVCLLEHLYIGNYAAASDIEVLKLLGITHIINCAPNSKSYKSKKRSSSSAIKEAVSCPQTKESNTAISSTVSCPYGPGSGIKVYKEFPAEDDENYNILQHFDDARAIIDDARACGGKALVHCAMGINRSGALCVAYVMLETRQDLVETVKRIKEKKGLIVYNPAFRKQLIHMARDNDLLYPA